MTRRMKNVLNEATTVTTISHRYELTRPKPTAVTIISHKHKMKKMTCVTISDKKKWCEDEQANL